MSFLEFCCAIRSLGKIHSFSVSSWGRTVRRNTSLGGVLNSWHLDFMAVDAVLDDPASMKFLLADASKLLLEVVVEDDHVHIEPAGPRTIQPAGKVATGS